MRLALIGATGMVGQVMRQVLEERQFLVSQLLPVASASNHGQWIN
ncbi:MAG: aspartate-semialdehyde dehydrogenase, partial [Schleiferiaceae bacterium]|nr:aspartate-semialdehyde dehydrogenase [Schleiferiaceae bacterium]